MFFIYFYFSLKHGLFCLSFLYLTLSLISIFFFVLFFEVLDSFSKFYLQVGGLISLNVNLPFYWFKCDLILSLHLSVYLQSFIMRSHPVSAHRESILSILLTVQLLLGNFYFNVFCCHNCFLVFYRGQVILNFTENTSKNIPEIFF